MTKKLWCHDDVVVPTNLKKNLPGNLWPYQKFRCTLALQVTKRTNKIEIFGFSDPANFLHQPASSAPFSQLAPSRRILVFFLGFQIPPIFCITQPVPLHPSRRILVFFLGFQIPPIFCISQLAPLPLAS
jgi:hypothetical protein